MANKAAEAVARARKSVEGAERHAHGLVLRSERRPVYVMIIDGRRREFPTLEAASSQAQCIFATTGVVVGIETEE